jgi:hypothetical protein
MGQGQEVSQSVGSPLEELQRQFAVWRGNGEKGRRIPEELWSSAAELAREIGVNPVVRALGLDYNRLKRRVTGENGSQTQVSPTPTNPTFVELAVDAVAPRPEWVVEFEGRSGKVTMRLVGQDSVAIAALAEALSRAEP